MSTRFISNISGIYSMEQGDLQYLQMLPRSHKTVQCSVNYEAQFVLCMKRDVYAAFPTENEMQCSLKVHFWIFQHGPYF